jgi:ABC-type sugar transport system substrate-binding protein
MTTLDGRAGARRSTRAVLCGSTALLLATALAACGSGSSKSGGSGTAAAAASGNCGTVPQKGFTDNSGVINSLGSTYTQAYNGYNGTVQASTWATWKPKSSGPYTIGISVSQLTNPYQVGLLNGLVASLGKQKNIGKVVKLVSTDQAANQVQQFRSLIAQKVDFIIYQPLSPDAFVAPAQEAAKAGIPSLSILNSTPTKDTVNLVPNAFLQGADTAAGVLKAAGGKGTILGIHGIPGVSVDTQSFVGIKAAISQCSGAKLDDSVTGQFQDAVAKTEVQKYLTSHPGKIAGVVMGGPMTTGVINAFKQAGKTVPPVAVPGGEISALAYWKGNSGYTTAGTGMGPNSLADAAVRVTEKMLAGDGLKVSDIVVRQTVITDGNLSQWVDASATASTPGSAEGPADNFAPDSYLAALFTKSS